MLFWLICLVGKSGAGRARSRTASKQPLPPRILLIQPGQLGSVIMTTAVLQALKSQLPQAHITMMVSPASRDIVERHPDLDALHLCSFPSYRHGTDKELNSWLMLLRQALVVRRERYDLAINLSRVDYWWSSALIALSSIPLRVGAPSTYGTRFLTTALDMQEDE